MPVARRWTVLAVTLLAGCADGPAARSLALRPGATYHSRPDNFTVVVPPLLGRSPVERESVNVAGTEAGVTFADALGTRLSVDSRRTADDDPRGNTRTGTRELADRYLDDAVLPAVVADHPGTAVVRRMSAIDTPAGPATVAIARVPGGGPNGEAVYRGLAAFPRLRWAYVVSVQQWPPTPNQPPLTDAQRDDRLLADLRRAIGQMTFN